MTSRSVLVRVERTRVLDVVTTDPISLVVVIWVVDSVMCVEDEAGTLLVFDDKVVVVELLSVVSGVVMGHQVVYTVTTPCVVVATVERTTMCVDPLVSVEVEVDLELGVTETCVDVVDEAIEETLDDESTELFIVDVVLVEPVDDDSAELSAGEVVLVEPVVDELKGVVMNLEDVFVSCADDCVEVVESLEESDADDTEEAWFVSELLVIKSSGHHVV